MDSGATCDRVGHLCWIAAGCQQLSQMCASLSVKNSPGRGWWAPEGADGLCRRGEIPSCKIVLHIPYHSTAYTPSKTNKKIIHNFLEIWRTDKHTYKLWQEHTLLVKIRKTDADELSKTHRSHGEKSLSCTPGWLNRTICFIFSPPHNATPFWWNVAK